MRWTRPVRPRTTRPYPLESGTRALSRVAAASAWRWVSTRRANELERSRGESPGTTSRSPLSSPSPSSSGKAVRATMRASPVPRCTVCSTKSMCRPEGPCSTSFLVTRSAPWPTTTTARSIGSSASESKMCSNMARPHSRCSGLGRVERMRVPSPAASTTDESGLGVMARC